MVNSIEGAGKMKVGVIGLGLIGGSMAKTIRFNTDHDVIGTDTDRTVVMRAKLVEAISTELTDDNIGECDMLIMALYPEDTINVLSQKASLIKKGAYVVDCGGIKEQVCRECKTIADENGFIFVGGHPMAGIEKIGFAFSKEDLFKNASMILTPNEDIDIKVLEDLKKFFVGMGFSKITIKTPKEHDEIIAYTSQLAHVLSSAYIKSETADKHRGLSAGSFKDMTRVAYLNETMWTELFMGNRENLINEIDGLINHLTEYKNVLEDKDTQKLKQLLYEGKKRKERIDHDE